MTIRIFVTGGTFDKEYNELSGQLFFSDTHLPEMLALGRSRINVAIHTLMMIDSFDMTEEDRATIAQSCLEAKEDRILITHGTDTIVKTARVLAGKIKNKTIVLTGAMIPYKFGSSDGLFNIGSASAFVQTLPNGVYVTMNGRCFRWNNVRKDRRTGEFRELEESNSDEAYRAELKNFIETVRSILGRGATDSFALEDMYHAAHTLGLDGVVYLEKCDDRRHVNVLLGLTTDGVHLYDPLSGLKVKPYNEIQFGMYCQPVGALRDEFEAYEQQQGLDESGDVWDRYGKRGRLLFDFLSRHEFRSVHADGILDMDDLPTLQNNRSSSDCAPICLFIMSRGLWKVRAATATPLSADAISRPKSAAGD
jgi:L-asparaginase